MGRITEALRLRGWMANDVAADTMYMSAPYPSEEAAEAPSGCDRPSERESEPEPEPEPDRASPLELSEVLTPPHRLEVATRDGVEIRREHLPNASLREFTDQRIRESLQALLTRGSETALRELDATRAAFGARCQALTAALLAMPEQMGPEDTASLVEDLSRRAVEETHAHVRMARAEAQARTDVAVAHAAALTTQLEEAQAQIVATRDRGFAELAAFVAETDATKAAELQALEVADAAVAAARHAEGQAEARLTSLRAMTGQAVPLDRLLGGLHAVDKSTTITEALSAFLEVLSAEFAHVALFTVKDERLAVWRSAGFDAGTDVEIPLAADSALARAFATGRPMITANGIDGSRLTEGRSAMVLPILAGGSAVAIAYLDYGEGPSTTGAPDDWTTGATIAEILAVYAGRSLTRLDGFLES